MCIRLTLATTLALFTSACATAKSSTSNRDPQSPAISPATTPPALVLGNFDDDYGGRFAVSPTEFVQLPRGRFHIVEWNVKEQYFIAQNDSLNRADPSKWTRIDWMPLSDMAPYTWAFCFTAFKANSRAEAQTTPGAKRETPKTGCGGFPFTRMKTSPPR